VSLTPSVDCGVRVTVRSSPATFWLKSEGRATSAPFTSMVAEDTRCEPSGSPFSTFRTYGETTPDGTATVSVKTFGSPVVRV